MLAWLLFYLGLGWVSDRFGAPIDAVQGMGVRP